MRDANSFPPKLILSLSEGYPHFVPEIVQQLVSIYTLGQQNAGGGGAGIFRSEKFKPQSGRRDPGRARQTVVAGINAVQTLLLHHLEGRAQTEDERDRRGKG